jgi:hypothetical protein
MDQLSIGTADIPARIEREKYFAELSYVELSVLFAGPVKPGVISRLAAVAPPRTCGLVAPFVFGHRTAPRAPQVWPHDATTGDFRDSPLVRATLPALHEAVTALTARCVVVRSPDTLSPSAANRDRLRAFFSEIATADAIGAERVWQPGGLWSVRTAVKLATELGVTCAFDPLVRDPGEPLEIYFDLDAPSLYFRIEGAGRAGAIRSERLDDLAELIEHYQERPITIAFASPNRWQDARNLKRLLEGIEPLESEGVDPQDPDPQDPEQVEDDETAN